MGGSSESGMGSSESGMGSRESGMGSSESGTGSESGTLGGSGSDSSGSSSGATVECCYLYDSSSCLESTGTNSACDCEAYPAGTDCTMTFEASEGYTLVDSCAPLSCCWAYPASPGECKCLSDASFASCYSSCSSWLSGLESGGNVVAVGSCP